MKKGYKYHKGEITEVIHGRNYKDGDPFMALAEDKKTKLFFVFEGGMKPSELMGKQVKWKTKDGELEGKPQFINK